MPGRTVLPCVVASVLAVAVMHGGAQAGPTTTTTTTTTKERRQGVPADRERRQGVPADQAPWFGTWQLVQEPAGWFATLAYKKVMTRIEPWDQGIRVTYDLVKTRGGIEHREWTGKFDGQDYAVQGLDYVLTNAYRPIDARSYEITIKRDGRVAARAVAVVSADGATLTVTTTENDARGRAVTAAAVYRKLRSE